MREKIITDPRKSLASLIWREKLLVFPIPCAGWQLPLLAHRQFLTCLQTISKTVSAHHRVRIAEWLDKIVVAFSTLAAYALNIMSAFPFLRVSVALLTKSNDLIAGWQSALYISWLHDSFLHRIHITNEATSCQKDLSWQLFLDSIASAFNCHVGEKPQLG